MNLGYQVELSQGERDELKALITAGTQPVRKLNRAQVLLAADDGATDEDIASSAGGGAEMGTTPASWATTKRPISQGTGVRIVGDGVRIQEL